MTTKSLSISSIADYASSSAAVQAATRKSFGTKSAESESAFSSIICQLLSELDCEADKPFAAINALMADGNVPLRIRKRTAAFAAKALVNKKESKFSLLINPAYDADYEGNATYVAWNGDDAPVFNDKALNTGWDFKAPKTEPEPLDYFGAMKRVDRLLDGLDGMLGTLARSEIRRLVDLKIAEAIQARGEAESK